MKLKPKIHIPIFFAKIESVRHKHLDFSRSYEIQKKTLVLKHFTTPYETCCGHFIQ